MKTNLTKKQSFSILAIVVIGVLLGVLIMTMGKAKPAGDGHGHGGHAEHAEEKDGNKHAHAEKGDHDEHGDEHGHEEEQAKGPHGGKLFTEGDFGLEVALNEEGGEPRFHVYLFEKEKPLAPNAAKVSITLTRPDGEKQELAFTPEKDYLKSAAPVAEPHVFEATVAAQTRTEPYLFTFEQAEGTIEMGDEQAKAAGVTVNSAGPAKINSSLILPGEIRYNEDRTAHVVPRMAGVVESVHVNLGQKVKKGQVLAVIASSGLSEQRSELLAAQKRLALARTTYEREKKLWQDKISAEQDYLQAEQAMHEAEIAVRNVQQKLAALGASTNGKGSLSSYEIRAPFDGMIMEKHISLGEAIKEDADIFTISDLSTVWAEVAVPAKDLNMVRVGEKVTMKATAFDATAAGTISFVGSLLGEQTRTAKARVSLPNPDMSWRPGLFVNVEIVASQADVPVAVTTDAIQTVDDKPTIFVRVPGGFLPQQVTLGRTDGKVVEVVKGLKAGSKYAGPGSFIVKSEQGKASAEHTH
ncbi:efflux RND transporter periplasmic adaptor subunit [Noviherbaspirillum cavernae]|uniref:Efflux RND transporter periplasmic adaptor subunit n=1 Tax=Noviherbaspirillum cavernae TaxID=2320862 RepID=A0A418WZD7_9BURK|nr:efflux RND transporter periplasmic adaptor subunit [Noviherbaspirillum cavernae]RJG05445.1 efflux RND transporter periplasmic adaptor subunit [Noviherbaspirillum cavernae]